MTVTEKQSRFTQGTIYKMIIAMTFLLALGLIMIFSASDSSSAYGNLKTQLIAICGGAVLMLLAAFIPYGWYKKLGWPLYLLSFVLPPLVKTGLGVSVNGASRWIKIPGTTFQIQIADVTRFLIIIFIAYYISAYWRDINSRHWITGVRAVVVLWVLVGLQAGYQGWLTNNMSSCIVTLAICYCVTFVCSRRWDFHLAVLAVAILAFVIYVKTLTGNLPDPEEMENWDNFREKRIYGWLYTEKYADSAGFQVLQSLYAIGSGSLIGTGLGNGVQSQSGIISEAQNDMIFAIVCEELGIVGAVMLFLMYGYLLYQMSVIVRESTNVFGSMVVLGVMLHLICQIVINVCVATNLIPNTGVSLPFISYGGTAVIMTLAECGVCIGIRRQQTKRIFQKYINE